MWRQIDEPSALKSKAASKIGPGPGVFKVGVEWLVKKFETLDIGPDLQSAHETSTGSLPFQVGEFGVVCAFHMLEDVSCVSASAVFREMDRVAGRYIVISLPDARPVWPYSPYTPKKKVGKFHVHGPWAKPRIHALTGED